MSSRFANEEWPRLIWKVLKHPAVEVTALVLVIVASAWIIADSDAFHHQQAMPIFNH
jgi:hypothetical protein